MTAEMWTIIGAAIALAAAILPGQYAIRRDLTGLGREVGDLRERVGREIGALQERMGREIGDLRERMARLEGLFEGFARRRKNAKTV